MWNEINNEEDVQKFMKKMIFFHDSCIKEIKYESGAYVQENLSMLPVNEKRILRVIIQRQFRDISMIEMEFSGLKYFKLEPNDETYTCEILDATLILKDDGIYWCDCGGIKEEDLMNYEGTLIFASKLRWRSIENHMGNEDYFVPVE